MVEFVSANQLEPVYQDLEASIQQAVTELGGSDVLVKPHGNHTFPTHVRFGKFGSSTTELIFGQPKQAAQGINQLLRVPEHTLYQGLSNGVASIVNELTRNGTDVDRECLEYCLHGRAGSSPKLFSNSPAPRDCDEDGNVRADRLTGQGVGMMLADFVNHPSSQTAKLNEAQVLALRLYTTAAFDSLNAPLRDKDRAWPHPLAITVKMITEAIKQLRANEAHSADDSDERSARANDLWRGLRDSHVNDTFLRQGGTELAPMSTTTRLDIAIKYAASKLGGHGHKAKHEAVLLRLRVDGFMKRGADLAYLSCFPNEAEVLYPPLTYMKPLGKPREIMVGDGVISFTVVDVEPQIG